MNRVVALILAGGEGHRLSILAEERTKPAVPFAGKYRIIDFSLSNCVHSGIFKVGVVTQYRPRSLSEHIGIGKPWDLDREYGGLSLLHPYTGRGSAGWYKGTADAIYQNLDFVKESKANEVLILAGDHVYKMRYDELVSFHRSKGADVTVGVVEVPLSEASRFGVLTLNGAQEVVAFDEKPREPKSRLASMGIYVFSAEALGSFLEEDARKKSSSHDLGRDIVPALLGRHKVYGYGFGGYWRDVGTVDSYWLANMEILEDEQAVELGHGENHIRTRAQDRAPARLGAESVVQQALVCHGCNIQGTVRHSVLGQGVVVEEGALVEDSIIFDDTVVKRGAAVNRSVIDKEVIIGERAIVGTGDDNRPNQDEPENLNTGITLVGKRAVVSPGVHIGRNCKVVSGVTERDLPPEAIVPSGSTVERRKRDAALERAASG